MTVRITDELIPTLEVKNGKQTLYMDSEISGLGINASIGGSHAWYLQYRMTMGGKHTWRERGLHRKIGRVTLGYWPSMSTDEARTLARAIIARGRDEHPSVHLKALTGDKTRGVRTKGGVERKPFSERRSFVRVCAMAYLCVLEARYAHV